MPFADFDRFDICEAYAVLEWDYNTGGILQERPSNERRNASTDVQLHRMRFRPRPSLSFDTLTDNGRRIYMDCVRRWNLPEPEYGGDTYIYQADVYCEVCAERIKHDTACPGNPDDESTFDSDAYPKGPFSDEESDTPEHCAGCGLFLRNPLTSDGVKYVRESAAESPDGVAARLWVPYYAGQGYAVDVYALPVFYRVGDADDYHDSDDIAGLAVDLATDGVRPPVERHGEYGLQAEGFRGRNYISAYHGDDAERPAASLSDAELAELNRELTRELAERD